MAEQKKPNVLLIMSDDVGWFDVGAYHLGIMGAATPNINRIAHDGVMLTDCYAQASCTAGRKANAERFGSSDPLAANKAVAPKE